MTVDQGVDPCQKKRCKESDTCDIGRQDNTVCLCVQVFLYLFLKYFEDIYFNTYTLSCDIKRHQTQHIHETLLYIKVFVIFLTFFFYRCVAVFLLCLKAVF